MMFANCVPILFTRVFLNFGLRFINFKTRFNPVNMDWNFPISDFHRSILIGLLLLDMDFSKV